MIKNKRKIIDHYINFFKNEPTFVYTPQNEYANKIILLLFPPCDKTNYWKLCSVGASNARAKKEEHSNPYNEYMMFISPDENLEGDLKLRNWYSDILLSVAIFAYKKGESLFYGHDLKFNNTPDEMTAVMILFPEIVKDILFVRKKIWFKEIWFLQVMPITDFEHKILLENGFGVCEKLFYPDNEENTRPFAQKFRSFD